MTEDTRYDCMLTTFDNPYDYFTQFNQWFLFDIEKGYNTCSYIARIANLEEGMSQKEVDDEIERAIDEILHYDDAAIYKKIKRITSYN